MVVELASFWPRELCHLKHWACCVCKALGLGCAMKVLVPKQQDLLLGFGWKYMQKKKKIYMQENEMWYIFTACLHNGGLML